MMIMASFTPISTPTSAAAKESGLSSEASEQTGEQADAGQGFAALLAAWFAPIAAPSTPTPLPNGELATGQAAYSFALTSDQQSSAAAPLPFTLPPELLGATPTLPAPTLAATALPEAVLTEVAPVAPPPDFAVAAAAAATVSGRIPLPIPTGMSTSNAAPDRAPAQLEITDSADVTGLVPPPETSSTGGETEAVKVAARVVKDILAAAETAPEHTSGNASEAESLPALSAREQASSPAPDAAQSNVTAPSLSAHSTAHLAAPAASESKNAAPPIIHQTIDPLLELAQQTPRRETRSLRFQLHPEELGRVDIEVTRDAAGRVSASLNADGIEAANTLTNGIGHLRAALEKAGVTVEHLDVHSTPQFQSNSQSQQQQQSPPPRAAPTNHFGAEQRGEEISATVEEEKLLNLRA